MTIGEKIQLVLQHLQRGDLSKAEQFCREILQAQPDNFRILHLLGVVFYQKGDAQGAINAIKKALQLNPNDPDAYFNLGNAYAEKGQLDDALTCFQKAVEINPQLFEAYNNIGNIFMETKQFDEGIISYQKALKLNPGLADAHSNLGNAFLEKGQLDDAIFHFKNAIQLNPNFLEAHFKLGNALIKKGQLDDAIFHFKTAIRLNPNFLEAYNSLGIAQRTKGQLSEAIESYRYALTLNPDFVEAYLNLFVVYAEQGNFKKAEECHRRVLSIDPNRSFHDTNFLYIMNYRYDAQTIFSEHLRFGKEIAESLSLDTVNYTNERILARRLRIGYVSPDFRRHAVAYFIEPILLAHHKERYEVFCYSNSLVRDEVTERIQKHTDHWRSIYGMSDESVAEQIRKDKIDILIDLAGYTADNRIWVFARKPAPIQVSWIGYLATTGLLSIDYKIADNYTDPPGKTERLYTEKILRLPESFLCYLPDRNSPKVKPLPVSSKGHITFGSFNNFSKVTPEVLTLWSRILNAVSDARLIMKCRIFFDKSMREHVIKVFAERGITAERIYLQSWEPSPRHLETYNLVDICLDTFPFNGATTTCESLWMGVPVVTLAGTAYHSGVGTSLLSNVGLSELVAGNHDEYISIAVNLAKDLKRLEFLRKNLRGMMEDSPLCDAKRFTRNLEACYRRIWEEWCIAA